MRRSTGSGRRRAGLLAATWAAGEADGLRPAGPAAWAGVEAVSAPAAPAPARASTAPGTLAALVSVVAALLIACGGNGGGEEAEVPETPVPRQASGRSPVAAGCTGGVASGVAYVNAEVEPWLAADPRDPNRLLAAWQQDRWSSGGARGLVTALSTDGGATWVRTLHPMSRCGGATPGSAGDFERVSDPWVDFGPDGVAYAMGLVATGNVLQPGSSSGMAFSRSTDGGRSWSVPVLLIQDGAAFFNDKNTLTADPTAAGFVYAVWNRLEADGYGPTVLVRSADGGRTWDPPRTIVAPVPPGGAGTGVSQTIGNRIVVLPGGTEAGALVNVFTQIDTVAGVASARVGVVRSLDKGQTWSAPVYVADQRAVGTRDAASGQRVRDGAIVPAIAAGPRGELWVAWQDARFTPGGTHDAIVVSTSSDGGRSWSAPRAVNRVAGTPAFTPALHVRADGMLGLLHFDLRNDAPDAATLPANAWLLTTTNGVDWTEAPVGTGFDLLHAPNANGLFIGDYHGLASIGAAFVPLIATTNADAANRTDVRAPLIDGLAEASGGRAGARWAGRGLQKMPAAGQAGLVRAHHEAIAAAMEQRVPGWQQRLQGRTAGSPVPRAGAGQAR